MSPESHVVTRMVVELLSAAGDTGVFRETCLGLEQARASVLVRLLARDQHHCGSSPIDKPKTIGDDGNDGRDP